MTVQKPRIRVPAGSDRKPVNDSFVNHAARLGMTANNLQSQGSYESNPISRQRNTLEEAYRGSWICQQAVNTVANDMTREGIEIQSDMPPDDIDKIMKGWNRVQISQKLNETIKWARLYGGAIGVVMIDGQALNTPLRADTVTKGQFKGILPLDRWMLNQALNDPITDFGPFMGKPTFYNIMSNNMGFPTGSIHYSRVIRLEGVSLPNLQRQRENGWGISVLEPPWDRIVAFDSATAGTAQMVHKAHIRTLKIEGMRALIAAGGKPYEALLKQVDLIRQYQSAEGMTLLDATDTYETQSYAFSGLSEVLTQLAQQLAGALQIPVTRLFGTSPGGMNSTGESDIAGYYDGIKQKQETELRDPVGLILDLLFRSELGTETPEGFGFNFKPLWQMSHVQKAEINNSVVSSVLSAVEAAVIDKETALKELRQNSRVTGIFSNITDEMIDKAENDPPAPVAPNPEEVKAATEPLTAATSALTENKKLEATI